MYYIAYKAFLFYLFSSGAHKQIFLLVDSHLLQSIVRSAALTDSRIDDTIPLTAMMSMSF